MAILLQFSLVDTAIERISCYTKISKCLVHGIVCFIVAIDRHQFKLLRTVPDKIIQHRLYFRQENRIVSYSNILISLVKDILRQTEKLTRAKKGLFWRGTLGL